MKPGRRRRTVLAIIVFVTLSLAASVAGIGPLNDAVALVLVLTIGLAGFGTVAALAPDCPIGWRFVDITWIAASFLTLAVALVSLTDALEIEQRLEAAAELDRALIELEYTAETIVTHDCQDRGPVFVEPTPNACAELARKIPLLKRQQLEFAARRDAETVRLVGGDVIAPQSDPVGEWLALASHAEIAAEERDRFSALQQEEKQRPFVERLLRSAIQAVPRRVWYFIGAMLVALRLSRTISEIIAFRRTV